MAPAAVAQQPQTQQAPPPPPSPLELMIAAAIGVSPAMAAWMMNRRDGYVGAMVNTRLRRMAQVLHRAAQAGTLPDPQELAGQLEQALASDSSASNVGQTEVSAAISAARQVEYRDAEVAAHEWLTAADDKVCPACQANADAGPTALGLPFPSGVVMPPAHPRCRCTTTPSDYVAVAPYEDLLSGQPMRRFGGPTGPITPMEEEERLQEPLTKDLAWEHELRGAHGQWTRGMSVLSGADLWRSGEGAVKATPQEVKAAKNVWYRDEFQITNDYLRNSTPPSLDARRNRVHLSEDDAQWLKDIATLKGLMNRAPAFSRPARMSRGVENADALFGPVGSKKGQVFHDPGFMSATISDEEASAYGYGAHLVINVPPGGRAFRSQPDYFVNGPADYGANKEYTFPPGTPFRVDGDKMNGMTREITVTEVVPAGARPGPTPTLLARPVYVANDIGFGNYQVFSAEDGQFAGNVQEKNGHYVASGPGGGKLGTYGSVDEARDALSARAEENK